MDYIAICNECKSRVDFKFKSKFARLNLDTFRCSVCKKHLSKLNSQRICQGCNSIIIYTSHGNKKNSANSKKCRICRSNQIPKNFTQEQKEIIAGLMLGDGSVPKSNRKHHRLSVCRQLQDKDYLFWQYEKLKDFYGTQPKYCKFFHKKANKFYEGYGCITKSGELLDHVRKKWYSDGVKIIPRDLELTPLTLLVWFLDDGCIINTSKNNLTIKFSTDGFAKLDVKFLSKLLSNFISEKINVYKNGNGFILKAATSSAKAIIDIINPIFLPCMERKRTW